VIFFEAYFDGSKGGGPYGFFGAGGGTLTALFWADDLDILFSKYNDICIEINLQI
jgi:hypothetical protein